MSLGDASGSLRSVDRLLAAGRDRWHYRLGLRLLRGLYGLAVVSLTAAASAQHAQTIRYTPKGAPVVITIVVPAKVGAVLGEVRGVATTTLTTDAGFGEEVVPCSTAEDRVPSERELFGCYESRYSITDTCKAAAAAGTGCVHYVPQVAGAVNGCERQIACSVGDRVGTACSAAGGVHITIARPYLMDNPYGAGHKGSPGDAACNHIIGTDLRPYNRVFNYCQRRWESLDCAWCPRRAIPGGCNRYCDGLVITCTKRMGCREQGNCRLPSQLAPDKEGWLDANGDVKCLSSNSETPAGDQCKPEFAPDGDKDGDGLFDEGDIVEGKIKFDPNCDPSSAADLADPNCYVMFCPAGSSQVYTGVSVPGARVRPRCQITNACEFNQDLTGINGNCGCQRGGTWTGDECDESGECPAGFEDVDGVCQCPQGQRAATDGTCIPIDLSGVSPFQPQVGCALDEDASRWVIDRLGNTFGAAFVGIYNNTYNPACSLLVRNVAFLGAGSLRNRLEGYGAGTCPAIAFGEWSLGGEVLVQSSPGTWHRQTQRKSFSVGGTGFICDWLDRQRELVGRIMVFIFNLLALANIIGRRAF